MFMRMVQLTAKPEMLPRAHQHYTERVVPTLAKTGGCLFASLLQNSRKEDEIISMTLWSSEAEALRYERSGVFKGLLDEARPMLADSTEWQVQLSSTMTLEYAPVAAETTVKSFSVETSSTTKAKAELSSGIYLRIVSLSLRPGKEAEFHRRYDAEVIPALRAAVGCRHAFLVQSQASSRETLSITVWDSMASAERYESGGEFRRLLSGLKDTLADLYQWKMDLEQDRPHGRSATTNDIQVAGYNILVEKNFRL